MAIKNTYSNDSSELLLVIVKRIKQVKMLKTSSFTLLYMIVLFYEVTMQNCPAFFSITAYSEKYRKQTTTIEPGTTEVLIVYCSVDVPATAQWKNVSSITLLHSRHDHFSEVRSINADRQLSRLNEKGVVEQGLIYNEGRSFLRVEWEHPEFETAGKYRCDVEGNLQSGDPQNCSVYEEIYSSQIKKKDCYTSILIGVLPHNGQSKTTHIEPGVTKTLFINCSVDITNYIVVDFVKELSVSWSDGYGSNKTIAFINSRYNEPLVFEKKTNIVVSGGILNTKKFYLNVQISSPSYSEARLYACHSSVKLKSGESYNCTVKADIFAVESCLSSINITTVPYKGKSEISKSAAIVIDPLYTEKFLINCSYNTHTTESIDFLDLLKVLRADVNKSDHQEVASISKNVGSIDFKYGEGYKTSGIRFKGESYLLVNLSYPDHELEGSYTCEAHGISKTRKPDKCSSSATITFSEMTLKHVMRLLRLNLLKQKQIVDVNMKLNVTVHLLKGAVDKLLDKKIREAKETKAKLESQITDVFIDESFAYFRTYFFESELYSRRRYYLSKVSSLVLPKLAQDTCETYGGYLAEINDSEELNFLREFLNNNGGTTRYRDVLISGSDEKNENEFRYARNNFQVIYLPWGDNQPNGKNQENCLSLQFNASDWYLNDVPCLLKSTEGNISYVCEIEDTLL